MIGHDLPAAIGAHAERIVEEEATRVRLFAGTLSEYEQRVVDDVQQRLHDEFVDTSWPSCPLHRSHPLWLSEGWWRCPAAGAIARLGELG